MILPSRRITVYPAHWEMRKRTVIRVVKHSSVVGSICCLVRCIVLTLWVISTRRAPTLVLPVVTALDSWSLHHPYTARFRQRPLNLQLIASHSKFIGRRSPNPNSISFSLQRNWKIKTFAMQHYCVPETKSSTEEEVMMMDILQQSLAHSLEDVSLLRKACQVLESTMTIEATSDLPVDRLVVALAMKKTQQLCQISSDQPDRKRKATWNELQLSAQQLVVPTNNDPDATALAVALIFGVLALTTGTDSAPGAKAAASALSTTISSKLTNNKDSSYSSSIPSVMLRSYFQLALAGSIPKGQPWNWNILTQFTRAFHLNEHDHPELPLLLTKVVEEELERIHDSNSHPPVEERKQVVAGLLALTCQIKPWCSGLSPLPLVQAAIPLEYWHAAELLCQSANTAPAVTEAVLYLIDCAMEEHTYRRADTLATNLYDIGGQSRYIQARFQHACDTISQVIYKRQLPIIERQVNRVDKAVERVLQDDPKDAGAVRLDERNNGNGTGGDARLEIRRFALTRLDEVGEHDMAHRLATTWEMDYVLDPQALQEAARVRRQTYLQFDEVLNCPIPDVLSDAETLRKEFQSFWTKGPYPHGPIGMDAEWEEDSEGVDLLQLSHPKQALLIDIPALVATAEGHHALQETVGQLFHSLDTTVVGFACRQDLSRLRRGNQSNHNNDDWLVLGTRAVIDLQPLVLEKEPLLATSSSRVGLSRMCQYFFGKPLDKSEQCSYWGARPLSLRQRSYAALDAWVCAAVYERLYPTRGVNGGSGDR